MNEKLSLRAIDLIIAFARPNHLCALVCVSKYFRKQVRICMIANIKNKLKISENSDEFNEQNLNSLFSISNLEDTNNNELYPIYDCINNMFITADKLLVFIHHESDELCHGSLDNFWLSFDIFAYIKKDNMFIRYSIDEMSGEGAYCSASNINLIYSDTNTKLLFECDMSYDKLMHYVNTDDKNHYDDDNDYEDNEVHCLLTSDVNVPIIHYRRNIYLYGTLKIDTDINKFFNLHSMKYGAIFKRFKTNNNIYTLNNMISLFHENTLLEELSNKSYVRSI